jgi:Zn-dependent peptidase ImmA (M78 family)
MPLTDENFERTARKLRLELGVDKCFCVDLIFVLNELKRLGRIKDYVRVPDDKMSDEAYYDPDQQIVYINARTFRALDHILAATKRDRRRARFTLAHEIAHVAFGHEGLHYRGVTSERARRVGSRMRPGEIEANRFASTFLAPFHLAKDAMRALHKSSLTDEHLSDLFDINITAAEIRNKVIERMDRRAHGVSRALPRSVADLLKEAVKKGHRVKSLAADDDRKRREAKARGYEDKACEVCSEFTLKRGEFNVKCDTCGYTRQQN